MIEEEYKVLNSEGNPVERENYQREIVEYYRKTIDVLTIENNCRKFIFPYQGILELIRNEKDGLIIKLEGNDDELDDLKKTATIDGRFKLEKIK